MWKHYFQKVQVPSQISECLKCCLAEASRKILTGFSKIFPCRLQHRFLQQQKSVHSFYFLIRTTAEVTWTLTACKVVCCVAVSKEDHDRWFWFSVHGNEALQRLTPGHFKIAHLCSSSYDWSRCFRWLMLKNSLKDRTRVDRWALGILFGGREGGWVPASHLEAGSISWPHRVYVFTELDHGSFTKLLSLSTCLPTCLPFTTSSRST